MRLLKNLLMVIALFTCITNISLYAQETPIDRVPEVEAELRKDISEHISRLIPKQSFSVAVRVVPLKREPITQTQADVLPFYESNSATEFLEEWEDPNTSYYILLSRVKQVTVSLSVDKAYALKNESDFKENLFKSVGLVSGRDQLDIKMVELQSFTKNTSFADFNWWYIVGSSVLIIFFITIFILLNKIVNKKLPTLQPQENTNSVQTPGMSPAFASSSLTGNIKTANESNSINGDITFTDSLKLNSYLKEKIINLVSKKSFPTLSTLKTLEEFLEIDQMGFSYLMSHFPEDARKTIYSHGRTQEWIKAFSQPGLATKNVLLYTDRLQQCHPLSEDLKLENLFINTWRLSHHLKDFIISISTEEAKFILYNLPKSLSLPISRNLFPGDWAFLFSDKKIEINLTEKRILELTDLALKIKPLLQNELISFYTNQEELIRFLKFCSPDEERDIYQSYKGSPSLHELRSPFYAFFELNEQERATIFRQFDIRTWALATFNVSRELRQRVDSLLNEKERFLFKSYLTELDKNRPSQDQISIIRESIAKLTNESYDLANNKKEEFTGNVGINEKAA